MRRLALLLIGSFLLLGASKCERAFRPPGEDLGPCYWEPWRPNC